MKSLLWLCLAFVLGGILAACSQQASQAAASKAPNIKHGKYIVERMSMCSDCHTPRNEKGEYIKDRLLTGSTLTFKPTVPMPAWAPAAPAIAGLPGLTDQQAITILETGKTPPGKPALRPPMPEFRMSHEDAQDVVAYLRSLAKPAP